MFLFEIKQRIPRVLLMLKTLSFESKMVEKKMVDFLANYSQKLSSFKVILIECVYKILYCFSSSVLCKVS